MRPELVIRGGHSAEFAGSFLHSFLKALLGSPNGMFRASRRSGLRCLGPVGLSGGVVFLPGGTLATARWTQAFDIENSPNRAPQDLDDMKEFRGSLEFAQWPIPAWEALVANSNIQTLKPVSLNRCPRTSLC